MVLFLLAALSILCLVVLGSKYHTLGGFLGEFEIFRQCQVGEVAEVSLRGLLKPPQSDKRLQVLVRAEGPTRVLSITDLQVS